MTSDAKPAETRAPEGATARARARTCVGCQGHEDARERLALVRLVLGPGGAIAVDAGSGGFGRGAYVHARPTCVAAAAVKGLPRAARSAVFLADADPGEKLTPERLADAIARALDRRVEGLLASAKRARALALGADAVTGACQRGEARLVVVACDAAAAADLGEVRRAVSEGRAVAWATKAQLARAVDPSASGRSGGVGVVAITSNEIATALRGAVHARDAVLAQARPVRGERRSVQASQGAAGDGMVGPEAAQHPRAESKSGGTPPVVVGRSSVERGS